MKKFLAVLCLFAAWSCKKEPVDNTKADVSGLYVGHYAVTEDVKKIFTTETFHNEFEADIIKGDSLNTISSIQSLRSPKPIWVGPFSDTLEMRILPEKDSLKSVYETGLVWGTIVKPDTLKISYDYGAGYVYSVKQVWVRKR